MNDLRLLAAFVQAARCGSFTGAANVLRCSPGAISKNVARLEQDLGIRLFNRTTRQLSLTEEGAEFCEAVSRSLSELARAEDIAANARGAVEGLVRLSIGSAFGKHQVLPSLSRLLDRHTGLRLELAFCDDPGDLVANGHDLAVLCGAPVDSRYICRRLCSLPLMLVASAGYIERYGAPLHPHDLTRRDCINVRHDHANCGWLFAPRSGDGPTVSIEPGGRLVITQQVEAVVAAAISGFGPTVLDAAAAQPHLDAGTLIELLPDWRVDSAIAGGNDIYLVYPHRDYLPQRVRAVIEFLVEEFAKGEQSVPLSAPSHSLASARTTALASTQIPVLLSGGV